MTLGPITLTWIVGVLCSAVSALPLVLLFERGDRAPKRSQSEDSN